MVANQSSSVGGLKRSPAFGRPSTPALKLRESPIFSDMTASRIARTPIAAKRSTRFEWGDMFRDGQIERSIDNIRRIASPRRQPAVDADSTIKVTLVNPRWTPSCLSNDAQEIQDRNSTRRSRRRRKKR